MPITMSDEDELERVSSILTWVCNLRKSQECVVWRFRMGSGNTDTTPGCWAIEFASLFDKRAAKPEKPCL
jgi:hypothetical protein